jgi:hypothetical protein
MAGKNQRLLFSRIFPKQERNLHDFITMTWYDEHMVDTKKTFNESL